MSLMALFGSIIYNDLIRRSSLCSQRNSVDNSLSGSVYPVIGKLAELRLGVDF